MSDAHLFRWWTPEREGRPWFYWTRRDPNEQIGSEEVNEDELDDAVRPIVMRCLGQGWRTTPSCEGHFVGNAEDGIDELRKSLAAEPLEYRVLVNGKAKAKGVTSEDALRVWKKLVTQFPSSGTVIALVCKEG